MFSRDIVLASLFSMLEDISRRLGSCLILLLTFGCVSLPGQTPAPLSQQYFFNQASFATGKSPGGVAIADVNGDGRADLIVANWGNPSISILLGQADGTLGPKNDIPLQDSPEALVTGDFNGDGKVDVAVTQSSGVAVLLGVGDGTFAEPVVYALTHSPYLLAVS